MTINLDRRKLNADNEAIKSIHIPRDHLQKLLTPVAKNQTKMVERLRVINVYIEDCTQSAKNSINTINKISWRQFFHRRRLAGLVNDSLVRLDRLREKLMRYGDVRNYHDLVTLGELLQIECAVETFKVTTTQYATFTISQDCFEVLLEWQHVEENIKDVIDIGLEILDVLKQLRVIERLCGYDPEAGLEEQDSEIAEEETV